MRILRGLLRFEHYSDKELADLLDSCDTVEHEAGEAVFRMGEPADALCLILRGAYQVRRKPSGQRPVETVHHSGDIVGEMAVLDTASPVRAADVTALEPGAVVKISAEHLEQATARGAAWAARLMTHFAQILAGRLRELDAAYAALWKETRGRSDALSELQTFRETLEKKWKL